MKRLFFIIILILSPSYGYSDNGYLDFELNTFLYISSASSRFIVEDLKVEKAKDSFLGKIQAKATVNIKNLTDKILQISVYLGIFDNEYNLLTAGNYSSMSGIGGFKPRETATKEIRLGYIEDFSKARYYKYRIIAFLEERR